MGEFFRSLLGQQPAPYGMQAGTPPPGQVGVSTPQGEASVPVGASDTSQASPLASATPGAGGTNYYGAQNMYGSGFYQPDPNRPWGSFLDMAKALPARAAFDVAQLPTGVLEYVLGRAAQPGAQVASENVNAAKLLSDLQTQYPGRIALSTSPEVAARAGVRTIPVPPGGINAGNAAQYGYDPVNDAPFFPFIKQIPVGLPPYVQTSKDALQAAQMENQQAQAAYFRRNAGAQVSQTPPVKGLVPGPVEVRMGPKGPETVQHWIQGTDYVGPTDTGPGMPGTPPAALPGPPPTPPAATGTPPAATGTPAPTGRGAKAAAPTARAAAPTFTAGQDYKFTDTRTGEVFQGTAGANNTFTSPDGVVRQWNPKTKQLGPATQTGQPSPAPAPEPGATAGAAIGRALAPAPVQGPGPSVAPQPGEVGSVSPAFLQPKPEEPPAPAPAPAATAPVAPTKEAAQPQPGAANAQQIQNFNIARQANPAIDEWLSRHPEYKTLDDKVRATAYATRQVLDNLDAEKALKVSQARMAGPTRNTFDALSNSIVALQALITPGKDGKIPMSVLDRSRFHNVVGEFVSDPHDPNANLLGKILSPGGRIGTPIPGFHSIPQIATTQGDVDQAKAQLLISTANGILSNLARANSISGRLTNKELDLMRDAYVPMPGIDTLSSGVLKVTQTIEKFQEMRQQLAAGRITPEAAFAALAGSAGVGAGSGPRQIQPVEQPTRTLQGGE